MVLINSREASVTGNAAVQTIAYMKAGSELDFEVRDITGLKSVTIEFKETVKNAVITFEEVKTVAWDFQGTAISKFRISSKDEDKFGQIDFFLRIQESDLLASKLSFNDVKLYHNGKRLDT